MSRRALSQTDRRHGEQLGRILAEHREASRRSASDVALASEVSLDAVRSIEMGRVPTPAFLTVARLAGVLGLSLDDLHVQASLPQATAEPE